MQLHTLRAPSLIWLGAPLALMAPSAMAQDITPIGSQLVQAIQTGVNPYIAGKSTMARVALSVEGTLPAGAGVDALMRVFVGGVEVAESPYYSVNGPIDPTLSPAQTDLDTTVNFEFRPPQGTDVTLEIELNPSGPGQLFETDYSNNTLVLGPINFQCRGLPEVVYSPIDYRPSGGATPNPPNPLLIEPGVGDNFIQGIWPSEDIEYHRTDAPTKLWTSSLSGSGSALNSSLLSDLNMMNPQPDFIYGWIPGSLPYNGQAIGIPGKAAMGNTDPIRHQRTFAHEVGHLFGFSHISSKISTVGIDVEEHLAITEGLGQIKVSSLNDIMVAGQLTNTAWIYSPNYNSMAAHPAFTCAAPDSADVEQRESFMLAGVWNPNAGTVEVVHAVTFPGGRATASDPIAESQLALRAYAGGQLVSEVTLLANGAPDCAVNEVDHEHGEACEHGDESGADSEVELPDVGFSVVFPASVDPATLELVEVVELATGKVLRSLVASDSAPAIKLVEPRPSAVLGGQVEVIWESSDADGDALQHFLRYSPDGERMVPLASNVEGSRFLVDFDQLPKLVPGQGYLEVLATDGLNTSRALTVDLTGAGLTPEGGGSNAPFCHILTPDSGKSFPKAANVLLHASGWDLEDRGLHGSSIVWTSDLDGLVAVGRTTAIATLSVGVHQLSVTATDSSGMTTTDTHTVTITDRVVPDGGGSGVTCQTDLGSQGPGGAVLTLCGGNLSSGTTADLELVGAAPNSMLWIVLGAGNSPTPLFGGTLVPTADNVLFDMADAGGAWIAPNIPGGGGPATLYLQVVFDDAALAGGFGFSNALQVDFLP
ncbi:hypothetical protein [Engelhardtia mirabilis]|uniref:Uncharacterized protein n=1 Tax=Engelhardtia mirabilis TaxID=2528011 RepID=A0A518BIF2_9BACT|nr:hypothetical protein Pla133_18340 [Planctomycetes bacterium Pla133]QDV01084.1 hypothetical protein Pla86_18330 [Planctomycetes bacterium Pla86]